MNWVMKIVCNWYMNNCNVEAYEWVNSIRLSILFFVKIFWHPGSQYKGFNKLETIMPRFGPKILSSLACRHNYRQYPIFISGCQTFPFKRNFYNIFIEIP